MYKYIYFLRMVSHYLMRYLHALKINNKHDLKYKIKIGNYKNMLLNPAYYNMYYIRCIQ